jgi:hypothetical protein
MSEVLPTVVTGRFELEGSERSVASMQGRVFEGLAFASVDAVNARMHKTSPGEAFLAGVVHAAVVEV